MGKFWLVLAADPKTAVFALSSIASLYCIIYNVLVGDQQQGKADWRALAWFGNVWVSHRVRTTSQ